jgi:hypothetical protein
MNLIERAKNIIIKPKDEWNVISQETTSVSQLTTGYLLIIALIPAIAVFIKFGLFGYKIPFVGHIDGSFAYGIRQAVVSYITSVGGVFLSAFIIDALAPNFSSQKNFSKAFQLVVYSYTAMFIAGIFNLIPGLGFLSILGLYGLYLLYIGMKPMMQTPEEKVTGYFIISLVVIIVVYAVLFYLLGAIFLKSALTAAAGMSPGF